MSYYRFGSKQDEYNFFSSAFKLIDDYQGPSLFRSKCLPAYERLVSNSSGGSIENWDNIPLGDIHRSGFHGYQQAVETIFRFFKQIYSDRANQETLSRIEQLMEQAVAVLKRRISEVGRGGILGDGTLNHLNVIELWTRCLKESLQEISRIKSYHQQPEPCVIL